MEIISIVNQKGGVGKTTTTRNIAAGLAKKGKKIIVFDLDPQGNLTSSYGIDKRSLELTLNDLFIDVSNKDNKLNVNDIIISKENIDIVPSNIKLAKLGTRIIGRRREFVLKDILKQIDKADYDYCLLDCPPQLDLLVDNALTACNSIIVTVQPEEDGLEGLDDLLDTIEDIKIDLNPRLKIKGALITLVDTRLKIHEAYIEEIRSFFEEESYKCFQTMIHQNVSIKEARTNKTSVIEFDPSSKGAKEYMTVVEEIVGADR